MADLTSVELNLLVQRYLQDSGFEHAAYAFGLEAQIDKYPVDTSAVQPGGVVTIVQKGLEYMEMEAEMDNSDNEDYKFLKLWDLFTKNVDELKDWATKKKRSLRKRRELKRRRETFTTDVIVLEGHTSEVSTCAWSPSGSILASGSRDSTARIWTISDQDSTSDDGFTSAVVLKHTTGRRNEKSKDVIALDWNKEGTLLATGCSDGYARIWNTNGDLQSTLARHKGAIYSLKWNRKGNYLLTGSCDGTAIVWYVKEELKQQYKFHKGALLDVDWQNNVSFATGSKDNKVCVWNVGTESPINIFAGHQADVNCVKWDPTGTLLASCSDDKTAKIWRMEQDNCVHDLRGHSKEVFTVQWSPTGFGTNNPNKQLVLASASLDSTVKIWDVDTGILQQSLNGHSGALFTVAFSPDGEYLATGSYNGSLRVWSLKDGKIVKRYFGDGSIYEVRWNKAGDKVAACFGHNTVCVLNFRM